MALTITTLNNSASTPVAKTFTLIGRDRQSGEWLNTSDSDNNLDVRLKINQSIIGKNKANASIRRTLVQAKAVGQATGIELGDVIVPEEYTVNLTITGPQLGTMSSQVRTDLVAYVRNLCTTAVVNQLVNGEI